MTNRVMEIIKEKFHPEEYAKEQAEKEASLKEKLAFIDGVLTQFYAEKEKKELEKSKILFHSDPSSPCGFRPNKTN